MHVQAWAILECQYTVGGGVCSMNAEQRSTCVITTFFNACAVENLRLWLVMCLVCSNIWTELALLWCAM